MHVKLYSLTYMYIVSITRGGPCQHGLIIVMYVWMWGISSGVMIGH